MELKFTLGRALALLVLLAALLALGGFRLPADFGPFVRPWIGMHIVYIGGALAATMVDHWVGKLDRANLRFLYIIFGLICCAGALVYLHALTERVKILREGGL